MAISMLTINIYPEMEEKDEKSKNEKSKNEKEFVPLDFGFPKVKDMTSNLIKVIGVGGGGGNAVKTLYEKGIHNVGLAVCNTDSQALSKSPVPIKVQLGDKGLGVGGNPELGRTYAEESLDDINRLFDDETQMVFITAGMGGGTGTGAAPVIARVARDRGILTVGVVTLPFLFEMSPRINKALEGIEVMKNEVDSLLVINNERLLEIYNDGMTTMEEAFLKVDDVLATATKSIAEIITTNGIVNRDFKDVEAVMKNGGGAIMSVGYGSGENRLLKAMQEALNSPLLNKVDMTKIRRLLYIIYGGKEKPVIVSETTEINTFMDGLSESMEVWWGLYSDETLGDEVKVAIIATGFDKENPEEESIEENKQVAIDQLKQFYYPKKAKKPQQVQAEEVRPEQTEDMTEAESAIATSTPIDAVDESTTDMSPEETKAKAASWFEWLKGKISELLED